MSNSAIPLICNLTALNQEQQTRRQTLQEELRSLIIERQELPDGYTYRLNADHSTCLKVVEFITLERRCCPFFRFSLEFEPEAGPLWVRITGPEGAKSFLQPRN